MALGIKAGATLLLGLQFTDDEWAQIAPFTDLVCYVRVNSDQRRQLQVEGHDDIKAITIRGDTDDWPVGWAELDVYFQKGDLDILIPELENVVVQVLKGVSK